MNKASTICFVSLEQQKRTLACWFSMGDRKIHLTTHSGTHLDAPYHYHPTMDKGKPAWTIEQIPLDWCYGNGVVFDFSNKPDGYRLEIEDFKEALDAMDYRLKKRTLF